MRTKTVWKYTLTKNLGVNQCIDLPDGASPLRVAFQDEALCLWVCVVPTMPVVTRLFQFTATGQEVPTCAKYIGTATHAASATEWHVWEF